MVEICHAFKSLLECLFQDRNGSHLYRVFVLAGQIITTILAYTFSGISIVFAMLLMRGGVLAMAPIVDAITKRKRHIYWPSWVAALLSLGALFMAFAGKAGTAMTTLCAIDIALYLFVYFFRLLFMSNKAKSTDHAEKKTIFCRRADDSKYGVVLLSALFIIGLIGSGMNSNSIPGQIWYGFSVLFQQAVTFFISLCLGLFSYGTGLFGSLIYLDKRENTFHGSCKSNFKYYRRCNSDVHSRTCV